MKKIIAVGMCLVALSLNGMEYLKAKYGAMQEEYKNMDLDQNHCVILKDIFAMDKAFQLTEHQLAVSLALLNEQKPQEAGNIIFLIQKAQVAKYTPTLAKKLGEVSLEKQQQEIIKTMKKILVGYQPTLEHHKNCQKDCSAGKLNQGKTLVASKAVPTYQAQ